MKSVVIGIAGGSGSGKTTLSENIQKEFANDIAVLSHDYYYKRHDDLTFEERQKLNYDHPNAFDTDMLVNHLKDLKKGIAIEHPVYSFIEHNRENYTVTVKPKPIILVEGILIFENKDLLDLLDIKIFVDTDADIRFIRRLLRDVNERGRTIDSVINQYCNTVKPMHEQFVEYSKKNADLIVLKGGHNEVALNMIREQIKHILAGQNGIVDTDNTYGVIDDFNIDEIKNESINKLKKSTKNIIEDV